MTTPEIVYFTASAIFGLCALAGTVLAIYGGISERRRNVTFVRGKAEGPTKFPKLTPMPLPKGYLDAAEKLSKEARP